MSVPSSWPTPAALRQGTPPALQALLAAPAQRSVAVLGLGRSGCAMASYWLGRQATVLGLDDAAEAAGRPAVRALQQRGMQVMCGATTLPSCAALCLAPGVDPRHPLVRSALQQGIPVGGELAMGGVLPAPTVAVTGTNGKSTTTALCAALLAGYKRRVFIGGNFGPPILECLEAAAPYDALVLELSSYQLETAYGFAPQVGVVLNVSPDHLERYRSLAHYAAAKAHLVWAVVPEGRVILNADCALTRQMATQARAEVWWFSARSDGLPGPGAYLEEDQLVPVGLLGRGPVPLQHPRLLGRHNRS
ncbi:MAG: hypothetical protein EOO40_04860, partial [Deltaproteobacteria bacterium]